MFGYLFFSMVETTVKRLFPNASGGFLYDHWFLGPLDGSSFYPPAHRIGSNGYESLVVAWICDFPFGSLRTYLLVRRDRPDWSHKVSYLPLSHTDMCCSL